MGFALIHAGTPRTTTLRPSYASLDADSCRALIHAGTASPFDPYTGALAPHAERSTRGRSSPSNMYVCNTLPVTHCSTLVRSTLVRSTPLGQHVNTLPLRSNNVTIWSTRQYVTTSVKQRHHLVNTSIRHHFGQTTSPLGQYVDMSPFWSNIKRYVNRQSKSIDTSIRQRTSTLHLFVHGSCTVHQQSIE